MPQQPLPDSIIPLLQKMAELQASDLHLKDGSPPILRVTGQIRYLEESPLTSRRIERMMFAVIDEDRKRALSRDGDPSAARPRHRAPHPRSASMGASWRAAPCSAW